MSSRAILISIKPEYSRKILEGSKTVELRRKFPENLPTGTVALIYESAPTSALVGAITIGDVARLTPSAMWSEYGKEAGVSRSAFRRYFANAAMAFGVLIAGTQLFERPIPLATMREKIGVNPPQSYRYLSEDLVGLVHAEASGTARHKRNHTG